MTHTALSQITPIPTARIETFLPHLQKFMPMYEIVGRLREAAFLSQILHESGGLRYVREIASGAAYEGRKDLGNVYPGDGKKFKGRGILQITGRSNYKQISKALGQDFEGNPELLATPTYAVQSACWWWKDRGLNELADARKFIAITRRINGGVNGLKERQMFYRKALAVITSSDGNGTGKKSIPA